VPANYVTTTPSPIGSLLLASDGAALTAVEMEPHRAAVSAGARADDGPFRAVIEQLAAYFAGELTQFDLPLAPHGTAFQQRVWTALLAIPYGRTTSYGELASDVGNPNASRAVGLANGRNPLAVIVPCHRVIGRDGRLTGYGGGLDRKRWLLEHERAVLTRLGGTVEAAVPAGLW
jgi:methylated-DNA-[protein]-cysteine S-methyltransferase